MMTTNPVIVLFRQFARARRGVAALEFALIFPLMIALFFGVIEASDALSTGRRVALASNTLADLVAQETQIQENEIDDLFIGVSEIIARDAAGATITVVSVIANPDDDDGDGQPDGNPIVHWSYDKSGGQPYAPGAAYTGVAAANLLDPTASLIIAEISYPYTSPFATDKFISDVNFARESARWPRRSARVQLCDAGGCTS